MSKLNRRVLFGLVLLVGGLGFVLTRFQEKQRTVTEHEEPLLSREIQLWGKAHGPVQVRIDFKEQNGNRVTLEGHIRSQLSKFEVQWVLPEGVTWVDGLQQETIEQTGDRVEHVRTITVDVTWPLTKPHLVLRVAESESPEARGASTVFNLDPQLQDLEKEEIIRAHMKSRKIKKIVK